MPIILSIANQKGGCGKTTTVMNLAGGFTKANYKTLVVDADPQASAMRWSIAQGQGTIPFDVTTSQLLQNRFNPLRESDYDFIVIDCPAGVGMSSQDPAITFARHAIRQSDALLVPLRPSNVDFSAAATFVRFLAKEKPSSVKVAVLINGMQKNLLGRESHSQAEILFSPIPGSIILKTSIGLRTAIAEVSGSGKTILDLVPSHKAADEYFNLTKEIIKWLTNTSL